MKSIVINCPNCDSPCDVTTDISLDYIEKDVTRVFGMDNKNIECIDCDYKFKVAIEMIVAVKFLD